MDRLRHHGHHGRPREHRRLNRRRVKPRLGWSLSRGPGIDRRHWGCLRGRNSPDRCAHRPRWRQVVRGVPRLHRLHGERLPDERLAVAGLLGIHFQDLRGQVVGVVVDGVPDPLVLPRPLLHLLPDEAVKDVYSPLQGVHALGNSLVVLAALSLLCLQQVLHRLASRFFPVDGVHVRGVALLAHPPLLGDSVVNVLVHRLPRCALVLEALLVEFEVLLPRLLLAREQLADVLHMPVTGLALVAQLLLDQLLVQPSCLLLAGQVRLHAALVHLTRDLLTVKVFCDGVLVLRPQMLLGIESLAQLGKLVAHALLQNTEAAVEAPVLRLEVSGRLAQVALQVLESVLDRGMLGLASRLLSRQVVVDLIVVPLAAIALLAEATMQRVYLAVRLLELLGVPVGGVSHDPLEVVDALLQA
mmetsp:Transcript_21281/g.58169  ORF Transcript_21281/g.58169 Transcript_21281/m.58169 type:complete len:414 (-) Transcript_21281:729-1970(-)